MEKRIIDSFSYTHDNVGNRLSKTQETPSPNDTDKTINYTYDAIYRLQTAEPEKRGKGKLSEAINKYQTENYAYDAVGNRQSGPGSRDSYSYNAGNELITSTKRIIWERDNEYEYDLNSNLIKKTQTIKGKWKLITTYAYDDENRLIEVKIQKDHKNQRSFFYLRPAGQENIQNRRTSGF